MGRGSPLSPCVSPSRLPVFSCAHHFQAPATQAKRRCLIFFYQNLESCIHFGKSVLAMSYFFCIRLGIIPEANIVYLSCT